MKYFSLEDVEELTRGKTIYVIIQMGFASEIAAEAAEDATKEASTEAARDAAADAAKEAARDATDDATKEAARDAVDDVAKEAADDAAKEAGEAAKTARKKAAEEAKKLAEDEAELEAKQQAEKEAKEAEKETEKAGNDAEKEAAEEQVKNTEKETEEAEKDLEKDECSIKCKLKKGAILGAVGAAAGFFVYGRVNQAKRSACIKTCTANKPDTHTTDPLCSDKNKDPKTEMLSCKKYCDDTCNKKYPSSLDVLGSTFNDLLDSLGLGWVGTMVRLAIECIVIVILIAIFLRVLPLLQFGLHTLFPTHVHTEHKSFKEAFQHVKHTS